MNFASDCLDQGGRFRIVVIVADFTLECLVAVADTSIAGAWLTRELNALISWRGAPRLIVSDNGPEVISQAVPRPATQCSVTWHCIGPGCPQQSTFVESYIGRQCDEFLNEQVFDSLDRARRGPAARRQDYNHVHRTRPMAAYLRPP